MLWKSVLPVALIVLGIHDCSFKFIEIDKNEEEFAMSMEHVLFHFNENQNDDFAYKFLRVRRSLRKKYTQKYLVDLEMGRTLCGKYDEDIDNCPLQEGPGEKKVRCTYIVETRVWVTEFTILNSTCVQT
uniref:Cystatin-12 n=1 Tax=Rattus norvegicus TaxID=10116 RepID=CST12_RAT|nr:RecName: Full=Cystatin-12; AltName: Full=Cystatin TE-1; Flags: Precursor [Rattus norvegicus]AAL30842.1 cystatin TE-1 [Rattus norvegicus]|eukprot:NP_714956.1 cystatin-12 precursor [Rattus norvegicus]